MEHIELFGDALDGMRLSFDTEKPIVALVLVTEESDGWKAGASIRRGATMPRSALASVLLDLAMALTPSEE